MKVDWFWDQVEFVPGKGHLCLHHSIPQLHPTAHLLYLAAHLMLRHGGNNERLIWFYDVDRLILFRACGLDVVGDPGAHVWMGGLWRGTRWKGWWPGLDAPARGIARELSEGESWPQRARRNPGGIVSCLDTTWHSFKKHLSLPVRFRMIVALFFPSPDYICWRYQPHPEWLWPLFYFYRWVEAEQGSGLPGVSICEAKLMRKAGILLLLVLLGGSLPWWGGG